jgi:hypothetical protein
MLRNSCAVLPKAAQLDRRLADDEGRDRLDFCGAGAWADLPVRPVLKALTNGAAL